MTWIVKAKGADGAVISTQCEDANHTIDVLEEQLQLGLEAWVENAQGERTDLIVLNRLAGR